MAGQEAGKRQVVLFGVEAIHELLLPEPNPVGRGPCVVRAIHESLLPQSERFAFFQCAVQVIHELSRSNRPMIRTGFRHLAEVRFDCNIGLSRESFR